MDTQLFDNLDLVIDGVTHATAQNTVTLENPLGIENEAKPTTSGQHAYSSRRVVPVIKGNKMIYNSETIMALRDARDVQAVMEKAGGKRIVCNNCVIASTGALGTDALECSFHVLGEIQEV